MDKTTEKNIKWCINDKLVDKKENDFEKVKNDKISDVECEREIKKWV